MGMLMVAAETYGIQMFMTHPMPLSEKLSSLICSHFLLPVINIGVGVSYVRPIHSLKCFVSPAFLSVALLPCIHLPSDGTCKYTVVFLAAGVLLGSLCCHAPSAAICYCLLPLSPLFAFCPPPSLWRTGWSLPCCSARLLPASVPDVLLSSPFALPACPPPVCLSSRKDRNNTSTDVSPCAASRSHQSSAALILLVALVKLLCCRSFITAHQYEQTSVQLLLTSFFSCSM